MTYVLIPIVAVLLPFVVGYLNQLAIPARHKET